MFSRIKSYLQNDLRVQIDGRTLDIKREIASGISCLFGGNKKTTMKIGKLEFFFLLCVEMEFFFLFCCKFFGLISLCLKETDLGIELQRCVCVCM